MYTDELDTSSACPCWGRVGQLGTVSYYSRRKVLRGALRESEKLLAYLEEADTGSGGSAQGRLYEVGA